MKRTTIALAIASGALAGCAVPEDGDDATSEVQSDVLASCSPQRAAGAVTPFRHALLELIATTEGTRHADANNGYDITFGYHHFSSCEHHPHITVCSGGYCSDAAGRYQFLSTTWAGLGYPNFHPDNQDKGAMRLVLNKRDAKVPAARALTHSEFVDVMDRISWEWASLPPSRYGQPGRTMAEAWSIYAGYAAKVRTDTGGSAATIDRTGAYHVFSTRRSGALEHAAYAGGKWHWQNLGGVITGSPSVTYTAANHRFDVFATTPGGHLYQKTYLKGWKAWHAIGGSGLAGGAHAVIDRNGTYHVFTVDKHGDLHQATYTNGAWHWQNLGGTITGAPAVVYQPATHRFDVFGTSPNGHVYQKTYTGAWSHWHSIGGSNLTDGAAAVVDRSGAFHVFAINGGGVLVQATRSGGTWHWQRLGGTVAGTPAVTYRAATNRFDVFAASPNGHVYQKVWNGKWSGWHLIGGSGIAAAADLADATADVVTDEPAEAAANPLDIADEPAATEDLADDEMFDDLAELGETADDELDVMAE